MGKANRVRKQRKGTRATPHRRTGTRPLYYLAVEGVPIDDVPVLGGDIVYYDDEAHALLTQRGWVGHRQKEEGDNWEWTPSTAGLTDASSTSIWTKPTGFVVEGPEWQDDPGTTRTHYPTFTSLFSDLDKIEGWRLTPRPGTALGVTER